MSTISPRGHSLFTYIFILVRSILNFKVRWGRVCDQVFLNSVQYLFHVNNLSRNQNSLRSFVAHSLVQVQSLSSVANQSSLRSFIGSLRSSFKGGSFEFQLLISSKRSIPSLQERIHYSFTNILRSRFRVSVKTFRGGVPRSIVFFLSPSLQKKIKNLKLNEKK